MHYIVMCVSMFVNLAILNSVQLGRGVDYYQILNAIFVDLYCSIVLVREGWVN